MDLNEIKARMYNKKLYYCNDETLLAEQMEYLELLYDFNQTRPNEHGKREKLLKKMFAEIGNDCYIECPFHMYIHRLLIHKQAKQMSLM